MECLQCEDHVRLIREIHAALVRAGKKSVAGDVGRFAEYIDEMSKEITDLQQTPSTECAADDCKFMRPFHSKMIVCNSVWSDHYQHVLTLDHRVCDKYEHKDFHRTRPPTAEGSW